MGAGGRMAGAHLVAAVFVQHDQEDGHDHDDTDHDEGVEQGVEEALTHRGRVLSERRVNAEGGGKVSTPCLPCAPPALREPRTAAGGTPGTPALAECCPPAALPSRPSPGPLTSA